MTGSDGATASSYVRHATLSTQSEARGEATRGVHRGPKTEEQRLRTKDERRRTKDERRRTKGRHRPMTDSAITAHVVRRTAGRPSSRPAPSQQPQHGSAAQKPARGHTHTGFRPVQYPHTQSQRVVGAAPDESERPPVDPCRPQRRHGAITWPEVELMVARAECYRVSEAELGGMAPSRGPKPRSWLRENRVLQSASNQR